MALRDKSVAILGGGIAGMAAALALAQRGARVVLHEQAATFAEVGAGLQIGPNGARVLIALGLGEVAARAAHAPADVTLCNGRDGRAVGRVPMGAAAQGRWGAPFWQFHRADLLGLLHHAAQAAGVQFCLGAQASGTMDGEVLCAGDKAQYHAVIDASGVHSQMRRLYLGGQEPQFDRRVAWRMLVPAQALAAGVMPEGARVFMGPGRHLVAYPLRGRSLLNIVAIEDHLDPVPEGWRQAGDPDRLRAHFAGFGGPVPQMLAAVETTFRWGLFTHPGLPGYARGRLAAIGDAAHPMLPLLAQGAGMGLEDAWVLAAMLEAHDDAGAALAAYSAARRARATRVQRASSGNAWLYHLQPGLVRGPVHMGLRALSRAFPGFLPGRLDWLYGHDVTA